MNRQRFAAGVAAVVCAAALTVDASAADREAIFASHMQNLLRDGLHRRVDVSQLNRHASAARRIKPRDPGVDYALGLALQKKLKHDLAALRFHASLKVDPAYLPAWRALLRLRLLRRDIDRLFAESESLAGRLGAGKTSWENGSDRNAAEYLGRVVAYLSLDGVDLVPEKSLKPHDESLAKQLGSRYADDYERGKKELQADFDKIEAEVERETIKRRIDTQKKGRRELADIDERKQEAAKKSENLKQTAEQWKTWLDEQKEEAEKELKELQKDYRALQLADAKVSRLATRTTVEIGRLQTEYQFRGIRGVLADQQPAMQRLRQESQRYSNQRATLQRQAAAVQTKSRAVFAAYAAATRKYQNATGNIVKQEATLQRFRKVLKNNENKAEGKVVDPDDPLLLRRKLTQSAGYFPLDYEAEEKRLLQQIGIEKDADESKGSPSGRRR